MVSSVVLLQRALAAAMACRSNWRRASRAALRVRLRGGVRRPERLQAQLAVQLCLLLRPLLFQMLAGLHLVRHVLTVRTLLSSCVLVCIVTLAVPSCWLEVSELGIGVPVQVLLCLAAAAAVARLGRGVQSAQLAGVGGVRGGILSIKGLLRRRDVLRVQHVRHKLGCGAAVGCRAARLQAPPGAVQVCCPMLQLSLLVWAFLWMQRRHISRGGRYLWSVPGAQQGWVIKKQYRW